MLRLLNHRHIFRISFFKADNHYDILGVNKAASEKQVRKAYLQKAKLFHPDKNPSPEAIQKFKQLGEAYKVISDPFLRKAYDMGMVNPSMLNPDISESEINTNPQHDYYFNKWYGYKKPGGHNLRDQYANIYWEAEEVQKQNIRETMKLFAKWGVGVVMVLTVYAGWRESRRLGRKKKMENQIIKGQTLANEKEIGSLPVKDYIEMRAKENVAV